MDIYLEAWPDSDNAAYIDDVLSPFEIKWLEC